MTKRVFRYFFDFIDGQKEWLNRMAEKGYRLKKCGHFLYEFESCAPGKYEYAVELVGDRSWPKAKHYKAFMDGIGYKTHMKNINLNITYGKIKFRPWAKGWGKIATTPGGYNRELLILEKEKDDKPFELHTNLNDLLKLYKSVLRTYIYAMVLLAVLILLSFFNSDRAEILVWLRMALILFEALWLIPTVKYAKKYKQLKNETSVYD